MRGVQFDDTPNILDVSEKIRQGRKPAIPDMYVDPTIMDILNRCWSKNPAQRYTLPQIVSRFNDAGSTRDDENFSVQRSTETSAALNYVTYNPGASNADIPETTMSNGSLAQYVSY